MLALRSGEVSLLYLAEHPKAARGPPLTARRDSAALLPCSVAVLLRCAEVKRALGFLPAKMLRTWIEARLGAEMQLTENDDKELCCEFLNAPRPKQSRSRRIPASPGPCRRPRSQRSERPSGSPEREEKRESGERGFERLSGAPKSVIDCCRAGARRVGF